MPRRAIAMTSGMNLTDEEEQIILKYRQAKAEAASIDELQVHLLTVAAKYLEWLMANGAGSTFSTFCGMYGYDDSVPDSPLQLGVNASSLFRAVGDLISVSDDLAHRLVVKPIKEGDRDG
jgi:hypothetical protein